MPGPSVFVFFAFLPQNLARVQQFTWRVRSDQQLPAKVNWYAGNHFWVQLR